ncbi:putative protein C20orf85 [Galemys pyrenaicus]|uniref:Uncharacterized protein n=1 Tax=Galemys pyrenaicus TaxID=202257 RepID=A0A8J6A9X2_GALPY|nr:putative protein C20orf85 [Galemys pyrenaicus]
MPGQLSSHGSPASSDVAASDSREERWCLVRARPREREAHPPAPSTLLLRLGQSSGKYRLKAENEARQNWGQNWGFLTTPLEEVNTDFMSPEVMESIISKHKRLPSV